MDARHPYELISLFAVGIVLGVSLILTHIVMLVKADLIKGLLVKFPRNLLAGQILLGLGLAWFWLLIAPEGLGKLSALRLDIGEFNNIKPLLRIAVPIALVLVSISIRDFLAVRALGLLGLMAAAPLLHSAFLKDPTSRLLIPLYAYGMLTASMFWVGMPYLFRDLVTWVTAKSVRWQLMCAAGLIYGVLVLVCALAFWKNY